MDVVFEVKSVGGGDSKKHAARAGWSSFFCVLGVIFGGFDLFAAERRACTHVLHAGRRMEYVRRASFVGLGRHGVHL